MGRGFARDSYTYHHLSMVAGIVLFAVGVMTALAGVGDALDAVPALRRGAADSGRYECDGDEPACACLSSYAGARLRVPLRHP